MSFFDEWPDITSFFSDFLVACLMETDPRHRNHPFCNVFSCWSLLLSLSTFLISQRIATYCWSLSPFNKQITSFSIVWQEQHTLRIRDLHKTFQNMTSNYLPSFKILFCFFPSKPFLGLFSDSTLLWWTQCTQFGWTTEAWKHPHPALYVVMFLVRLGGPISAYLTMPHKLEFQTAEQTGLSCIKLILLQNIGLC